MSPLSYSKETRKVFARENAPSGGTCIALSAPKRKQRGGKPCGREMEEPTTETDRDQPDWNETSPHTPTLLESEDDGRCPGGTCVHHRRQLLSKKTEKILSKHGSVTRRFNLVFQAVTPESFKTEWGMLTIEKHDHAEDRAATVTTQRDGDGWEEPDQAQPTGEDSMINRVLENLNEEEEEGDTVAVVVDIDPTEGRKRDKDRE